MQCIVQGYLHYIYTVTSYLSLSYYVYSIFLFQTLRYPFEILHVSKVLVQPLRIEECRKNHIYGKLRMRATSGDFLVLDLSNINR